MSGRACSERLISCVAFGFWLGEVFGGGVVARGGEVEGGSRSLGGRVLVLWFFLSGEKVAVRRRRE